MKDLYERLGQIQMQIDDLNRLKEDLKIQIRIEMTKEQIKSEFPKEQCKQEVMG